MLICALTVIKAGIVCGFLASDELYNPLIATLPRILKLDVRQGTSRDWIEASVRFAAGKLTEGGLAFRPTIARTAPLMYCWFQPVT
jgi:hypothetical protein